MTIRDADSPATPKTKSSGAKLPRPKKPGPAKTAAPQPAATDSPTVSADAPPAGDVSEPIETDAAADVLDDETGSGGRIDESASATAGTGAKKPKSKSKSPKERPAAKPTASGRDSDDADGSVPRDALVADQHRSTIIVKKAVKGRLPNARVAPESASRAAAVEPGAAPGAPVEELPKTDTRDEKLRDESDPAGDDVEKTAPAQSAPAKTAAEDQGQTGPPAKKKPLKDGSKAKKSSGSKAPGKDAGPGTAQGASATKAAAKTATTTTSVPRADDPSATTTTPDTATKAPTASSTDAESSTRRPFLARLFTKKSPAARDVEATSTPVVEPSATPARDAVVPEPAPQKAAVKAKSAPQKAPAAPKSGAQKQASPAAPKSGAQKQASPAAPKSGAQKQGASAAKHVAPSLASTVSQPAASTVSDPATPTATKQAPVTPAEDAPATSAADQASSPPSRTPGVRSGSPTAARAWIVSRLPSLLWLVPALAVSAVITSFNMVNAPVRTVDESVYTAYAWALNTSGELARFAPWVDHPPLGWMQIAGYTGATNAFQRWDLAVLAGREAMIFFTLVSVLLVFLLARRMRLTRPLAAVGAVIFAVAPLSVEVHRTVSLDTVATPWLLLAILLAMSRRRQLAAFIASASVFGIAVLTKESFLLALPILAWVMVRSSRPSSRWYTLTAAAVTLQVIGGLYLLVSANQNRLGGAGTTLSDGTLFTIGERVGSGILFDPVVSPALSGFWQTDAALLAVSVVTSVFGLFVARTRPFAVFTLAVAALLFLPQGWLPSGLVVMALPFAALVIAGVVDAAILVLRRRGVRRSVGPVVALVAVGAGAAVAAPLWAVQLSGLLAGAPADPVRSAQAWLVDNADPGEVLLVDATMRVDLLRAGWDPADVGAYTSVDSASAPAADLPEGWQDADYIVTSTASQGGDGFPQLAEALERTAVLASYGTGAAAVEIRLVEPTAPQAAPVRDQSEALRIELGAQLGQNTSLVMSDSDRTLLTEGRVDARIIVVLGALAASGDVVVVGFPEVDGEQGLAIRQVAISSIADDTLAADGTLTPEAESLVARLTGPYAPDAASADGDSLLLRYPIQTGQSPE